MTNATIDAKIEELNNAITREEMILENTRDNKKRAGLRKEIKYLQSSLNYWEMLKKKVE